MKTPEWQEFYEKAKLLGHELNTLEQGQEITTYSTFASLPEGRKLLSVATPAQRAARQQTFFNPPLVARSRLGQGKHDRGEAILFADGAFVPGDHQGVDNHLPARIKALSVLKKRIPAGETWDVSVRGEQWGVDDLEELYTTVNVGELILEPGAKIVIRGNVFSLLCQRLVCLPATQDTRMGYHIGILPTPFSVDLKFGPIDGSSGKDGMPGAQGRDGTKAQIANNIIGYSLMKPISWEEMCGGDGGHGENASSAASGRNGGMCKIAEITVRDLNGDLRVFVQAGQGGRGGDGGHGGNGGDGGDGTDGHPIIGKSEDGRQLIRKILPAGQGGHGGHGGHGGKGGHGGNGGLASNVYINVPSGAEDKVSCRSLPAKGNKNGKGGRAGLGGRGGASGQNVGKHINGTDGQPGTPGKNGHNGRDRPAAWIFVNEQVRRDRKPKVTDAIKA